MKVIFKEKTYFIDWTYLKSRRKNQHLATTCTIRDHALIPLQHATVKKWSEDSEDKVKARRETMTRVLKTLFPGTENKDIRGAFWDTYHSRKPGVHLAR